MPSRELVFRISIQTNDAKRQAANVRSMFERELRQIKLDNVNVGGASGQVKMLTSELNNVAAAGKRAQESLPQGTDFVSNGIGGAIDQLKGLATAYVGLQAITGAIDLSKLGTQASRTYASLNILSGGGEKTAAVLKAIQKASNGTVTEMEAAGIATQGFALKLASTPAEFEKLTRAAREITQVSPIINDVGEALTQLSLFASNEASFARADQLGLAVGEVKDRMAELKRENDSLSGSQAKLLASMQLLDEKYGATLDTIEAQATGVEKLRVAWEDLKVAIATGQFGAASEFFSIDKPAQNLATIIEVISGNYTKVQGVIDGVGRSINYLENRKNSYFFPEDTTSQIEDAQKRLALYKVAAENVNNALTAGVPDAAKYQGALDSISDSVSMSGAFTDQQIAQLQELNQWYETTAQGAVKLKTAEQQRTEGQAAAAQAEQLRQANIFEQQAPIEQALAGAAAKVAPTAGIEAAIATYRQQKALVDQAIQQLIDSGVSDQGELAVRVAGIVDALTAPFDALEERATTVDFSAIGTAFTSLNQGFADFLPGVASAREELAALSEELAYTGTMTAEQAAQFDYLASIAYAVADGGSQLNGVVNELGTQFLSSNTYAAELVNQLFLAEAAFRNGQISAGQYAGMTAALTGNLLTLAQGAGIATGAIYALNQAQADMSNLPGYGAGQQIGGSISDRIATQQAASGREQNRREMERYNTAVARQQETSAKRAGKALEDGAKKASDTLKNALDKVPGLFSPTSVTEQDMKASKGGFYTDKADEYLRRLKDEVENGKDWAGVSIEEAAQAIEDIGVNVAATKEGVLAQFEELWANQALFSNESNIDKFINDEAVKAAQDLQEKSEEGRNNIYAHFGVVIDDAVSAVTGGGGGAAPAPVAPPKLVDIDPLTEGLQTGLDEYVNANGAIIKEQVAQAKNLFFDPANLFGTGGKTGATAMGPMTNPAVTVTADATAQALLPYVTGQQQATITMQATGTAFGPQPQGATPTTGAIALAPTLDTTTLQGQLDELALTAGVQLYATVEEIALFKATINGIVTPSVSVKLVAPDEAALTTWALGVETSVISPNIETRLNTPVSLLSDWTIAVETNAPSPNVGVLLHTTVEEIALFKETISGIVQPTVTVGLTLGADTSIAQSLSTAITTDIATNAALFATPGTVVAQLIMAAMLVAMKGGQQAEGGEGGGGPLAMALVTNLATQFSTNANMFYATGLIPAQNVEAGFKGYQYAGMADSLQAQLTQAIAAKAAEFILTGSYIGGWIQQGINQAFTAEVNLSFAVNAGASWGTAFMKGALAAVGGGTLVQAISDKVITDLATEMEQP